MEHLILYTNGCPKCMVLKNKLESKKIDYTENNKVEELVDLGFKSLPVLKVGDTYKSFVEANDWINKQEAK